MGADNGGDDGHVATVSPDPPGGAREHSHTSYGHRGHRYGHGHRWALDADRGTPVRMPSTKGPPPSSQPGDLTATWRDRQALAVPGRTRFDTWTTGPHSGAWTPTARFT